MDLLDCKLTRSGLIIYTPDFVKKYSRKLLNEQIKLFKFNTIIFGGSIIRHKTFMNFPARQEIVFARMHGLNTFKSQISVQNCILPGTILSKHIWTYTFTLFEHQLISLKYLMDHIYNKQQIKAGYSSCIFNMKAGLGKTYLSLALISKLQQKTLIIVPNSFLLVQWTKEIQDNMPNIKVGMYHAKKKLDGDIIIMVCNSALSKKFIFTSCFEEANSHGKYFPRDKKANKNKIIMTPVQYFRQFGLIVYDEIHKYCSPMLRKIFTRAQAQCVLGMSATTNNRLDKLDIISHHYLGPVIYADKIYNYGNNMFDVHVKVLQYKGPPEYTHTIRSRGTGFISHPLMINQICEDPYRKLLLCNELEKIYYSKANAFIFADRREYLKELAYTLHNRVKSKSIDIILQKYLPTHPLNLIKEYIKYVECCISIPELSILLGGSGLDDIQQAKKQGQIIFSTYAFLDTGVSIDRMTHLIIATPRRNGWEQIVGRICRLTGDQSITREILLLSDANTPLSKQINYAKNRIKKIFSAKSSSSEHFWESIN